MSGGTPTAPGSTGSDPDWADDVTDEADGFGFNIGEMKDATELDDSDRREHHGMDEEDGAPDEGP